MIKTLFSFLRGTLLRFYKCICIAKSDPVLLHKHYHPSSFKKKKSYSVWVFSYLYFLFVTNVADVSKYLLSEVKLWWTFCLSFSEVCIQDWSYDTILCFLECLLQFPFPWATDVNIFYSLASTCHYSCSNFSFLMTV